MSPLAKAPVFIPLGGGLQTDVDDKLLPVGKVLELENARIVRTGEIVKRFGATALPSPSNTPVALGTHKGALVSIGQAGAEPLNVLAGSTGAWGTAASGVVAGDRRGQLSVGLTKVAGTAENPTVAFGGGFLWVAYEDLTVANSVRLDAVDVATGHRVFTTTFGAAPSVLANKALSFVNGFAVLACEKSNNDIVFTSVNAGTFAVTVVTSAGASGGSDGSSFAIRVKDATTVQLLFTNAARSARAIDFVPSTGAVTAWAPKNSAGADIAADLTLAWMQDAAASGKIAFLACSAAAGLSAQWDIPTTGATRQAVSSYVLDAGATANTFHATGHTTSNSATGQFVVVYEVRSPGDATNNKLKAATRLGGVITTGFNLYLSMSLQSDTFTYGGDFYVIGAFVSPTQTTRYLLRVPTAATAPALTAPLATFAVRAGSSSLNGVTTGSVAQLASNQFAVGVDYNARVTAGVFVPDAEAVQVATIAFNTQPNTTIGPPKEAIDSLFVPGGNLGQYDGGTYAEAGFAYCPEQPTLTPSAGGALTAISTYWYVLLYSYMDAQGRLWRSAISVPKSVATGVGQGTVTVACPTLRLAGRANVQIEVYRGAAGDAITLQRAGTVANTTAADTASFVDSQSDAQIASKEFLYTIGGALSNDTPPGFLSIAIFDGRAWGVSADDPQALWYTNQFTLGGGFVFSESLVIDVRDQHGPIRGLAVVDDKLVVYKDDATYVVTGQGPNALGQGGTYAAQLVALGIGCSNPQSIVETSQGVMFRSTSKHTGIFLLDRGLSMQYVGAAVQRYLNVPINTIDTITGAVLIPGQAQVRFYTPRATTLVYDLVTGIWSIYTYPYAAETAVAWNGQAVFSAFAGPTLIEDTSGATYTDNTILYTVVVTSPWLSLNQLRGYERFYRVQPVGEVSAACTLVLAAYKDFDGTAPFTPAVSKAFAGAGLLDAELRYSAKLSALKLRVSETGTTAGVKLTGLSLIVGLKQGLKKMPSSNRMT